MTLKDMQLQTSEYLNLLKKRASEEMERLGEEVESIEKILTERTKEANEMFANDTSTPPEKIKKTAVSSAPTKRGGVRKKRSKEACANMAAAQKKAWANRKAAKESTASTPTAEVPAKKRGHPPLKNKAEVVAKKPRVIKRNGVTLREEK